jgi:hypothetical protein
VIRVFEKQGITANDHGTHTLSHHFRKGRFDVALSSGFYRRYPQPENGTCILRYFLDAVVNVNGCGAEQESNRSGGDAAPLPDCPGS